MRYDRSGRPITASASGHRCNRCDRPFAAGHLPHDGTLVCRDCRAEAAAPDAPTLDLDQW